MSGTSVLEVEQAQPVAVIGLRGRLDAAGAAHLRAAILECLAEAPVGLLVDITKLDLGHDGALDVLVTVVRQSQRWPGARVAVAGVNGESPVAAGRAAGPHLVLVYPDRATALRELDRWPYPPRRRDRIAANRNAPAFARTAVVEFCADHGVLGDNDAAQLVASELVTNAVVHAGTAIDLTLRLVPPLLEIAVRDEGGGRVHLGAVIDDAAETGRGLILVDALATRWGSFVPATGKVVWATVRVRLVGDQLGQSPDLRV